MSFHFGTYFLSTKNKSEFCFMTKYDGWMQIGCGPPAPAVKGYGNSSSADIPCKYHRIY
jgi:hypothetical protein